MHLEKGAALLSYLKSENVCSLLTPQELFMLITWWQGTSPCLSVTSANEALQDRKEQSDILKQQGQRWCCLRVFNVFVFVACAFSFHTQRSYFSSILDLPLPYFPHTACFLHT